MSLFKQFTHVSVTVTDVGKAREFYSNVLGFQEIPRPAFDFPGRFLHDRILIRRGDNGLLNFQLSVGDMRFKGVAFPSRTQVFGLCADAGTGVSVIVVVGTPARRAAAVRRCTSGVLFWLL